MKITDLSYEIGNFQMKIDRMELTPGQVHGLIGPNGCGKTTLAKLIMGVYHPRQGRIDYEGISEKEKTMITQRPYLLHDSVWKNLIYPLKLRKRTVNETEMEALLERCGLIEKKKVYARSLSSGERQKLAFLRAIIFNPELIVIDETFSNLDPDSVTLFEDMILEQQKTHPITWIIISHQLVHIRRLCDQVHFLDHGRYIAGGSPEAILLHPQQENICRYLRSTELYFEQGADLKCK